MKKENKCQIHKLPFSYLSTNLENEQRFFCADCLKEESVKQNKEYLQSINDFLFSQNQPNKNLIVNLQAKADHLESKFKKGF